MEKVVFIDRDGVINKDLWRYVEHWGEFEFIPGVLDALRLLTEAGFKIYLVSNQAGIGDGKFTRAALDDINENMLKEIAAHGGVISGMYYCMHGKQEGCSCRKPEIGLLTKAEEELPAFDKKSTFFIGDKTTDIQAGKRFGVRTILVLTGYGEKAHDEITDESRPDRIEKNLLDAVNSILIGN